MGNEKTTPDEKPTLKTPEKKHKGLPRTAAAAKKHGFKKVKVNFDSMSEEEKKKYVHIAAPSARSNAIALVRPADSHPEHVTPGAQPGTYIVCYYDPQTGRYDKYCHAVPALDSGAKCNGSMRSGFGRLCQAL